VFIGLMFLVDFNQALAQDRELKLFDFTLATPDPGGGSFRFGEAFVRLKCELDDKARISTPESEGGSVVVANGIFLNGKSLCRLGTEGAAYHWETETYRCYSGELVSGGAWRIGQPIQVNFRGIGTISIPIIEMPDYGYGWGKVTEGTSLNHFELRKWGGRGIYGNTTLYLETSCEVLGPSLCFAQFGEGAGQLFSQITLINLDSEKEADVRVFLRDDQGDLLPIDLNGETCNGALNTRIPVAGLRTFRTDGEGLLSVGSAGAYSRQSLAGVILFGGSAGVAGVGDSTPLKNGFVAPMESNSSAGVNTGLAVMNLTRDRMTVELQLCGLDGSELAAAGVNLAAKGHLSRYVNEFDWNETVDFSDFRGVVRADAPPLLAATVIQTRPGEFATMPVVERLPNVEDVSTDHRLYFAQFGDGEGQLFSQILLVNQNEESEASATVSLRDDKGEPLEVDLNGEVVDGSVNVTIPAGGMKILKTDGEGELVVGSVTVTSDQPLGGVVLFGGSAGVAGVGASEVLSEGFLAPIEKNSSTRINTGIAVMNLETEELTLELELMDPDAEQLATAEAALVAGGHHARFVNQFEWSKSVDFSSFEGILKVGATGRCAGTVIQTRPRQFATMPVVPR
jgi:hypothetical protein